MICLISQNRKNSIKIRKALLKSDIFSYQKGFPSLENARGLSEFINNLPSRFSVALVDAAEDITFGNCVCNVIKKLRPDVTSIVLFDRKDFGSEKFKYFPMADHETDMSQNDEPAFSLSELLTDLGYIPRYEYRHLILIKGEHSAIYLGMKMKLTEAEYRILLFICTNAERIISQEEILAFCFAESYRMTLTNVRHHVSNINRKSKALGGRKIIVTARSKGYRINEFM